MFRVFAATLPLLGLSLTSRDLSALEVGWPWVGDGHCDPPCRVICSHQGCERLSPRLVGLLNPQVAEAFTSSMDALRIPMRAIEEGVNPRKLREIKEAEQRHMEAQRSFDES